MNKKVFILPLAVAAMGLTSCNKGFSRHNFEEAIASRADYLRQLETIISNQTKEDKLTLDTKVGSISENIKQTSSVKKNGITYASSNNTSTISGNYSAETNTVKLTFTGNTLNEQQSKEIYYKASDVTEGKRNIYTCVHDKMSNAKTKKLYYPVPVPENEYSFVDDLLANAVSDETSCIYLQPSAEAFSEIQSMNLYYNITTDWGDVLKFIDALNGGQAAETGDKLKFAKHKNDDKSASISYKNTVSLKDFFVASYIYNDSGELPEKYKDFEGTVDVDAFYCLEENFVTQLEVKVKYNNAKLKVSNETTNSDDQYELQYDYSFNVNIDYKNGSTVDVKLDEFIEDLH